MKSKDVPQEVQDMANVASLSLLPERSRGFYEKTYDEFIKWCNDKGVSEYTEVVLLAYFANIVEKGLIASLWPKYSMLKATLNLNNNVDISRFNKLIMYIKRHKEGYTPKKSKIFEKEQVHKFIAEAPDNLYLMTKVALIFGVAGALRKDELLKLQKNDVQDLGSIFLVTIKASSDIAKFLKLEQPHLYTGHCFRRSSASILSDAGADFAAIKLHGGWRSTSVAEGYIENSIQNKVNIAEKNPFCSSSS